VFPIRDRRGRVIAFGGRVLGDDKPKYLNSPETPVFHKGRELYGLHEAQTRQPQLQRIIVVEGYMDVIALAQAGITYAVATLGTATSRSTYSAFSAGAGGGVLLRRRPRRTPGRRTGRPEAALPTRHGRAPGALSCSCRGR
jgi:DNA primase catalytic core